jgi:hypothetical protein
MSAPVPAPTPPLATALAASGPAALPSGRKMVLLWTLYFVEGLPWGIQIVALPAILTEYGLSLTKIGFATALGLPWMLKIAWAPLVDRYGSRRFGRRRSWIVPLQLALAAAAVAAAALPLDRALAPFLLVLLAMNAIAATLDIAVDGLAVDLLELGELGRGNVAQVVGYKLGMLAGGGVLVWASAWVGWNGLFLLMALAILVAVALTLRLAPRDGADSVHDRNPPPTLGGILRVLGRSLASRRAAWLLLFVGTYKFGESMADTMFKPFVLKAGFTLAQYGAWVGIWGIAFSIAGSIAGGWLATRYTLLRAVGIAAALRLGPLAAEWWLSLVDPTPERVILVTCAENFFGGALTTTLFAFMMSRVDKRIGATHFTALAAVEVWGKLPAAWLSGALTDATSYPVLFGLATLLSAAFLLLLLPLRRDVDARGGGEGG